MRRPLWTFLVILCMSLTSCIDDFAIFGNGEAATENRWTSAFNEVKVSGEYEVTIVEGDDYSVAITAESNLLPYIITDNDGSQLKIRTQGIHNLHNTLPMQVYITTPYLRGVNLSGSGFIQTDHFSSSRFNISLSGSGQIETSVDTQDMNAVISGSGQIIVAGYCEHSDLLISGSGKILSYELEQSSCDATISGSGNMYVNVENRIEAKISGSGNVLYINYPEIRSSLSGSGKVINDN